MRVASLHIHPVKGCRATDVDHLDLDHLGAVGDRRLMLVDLQGRFVSQRELPALARLVPTLEGDTLQVRREGTAAVIEHRISAHGSRHEVTIWGDTVHAVDQGESIAAWFSAAAGAPLRLVWHGPDAVREIDPEWAPRPGIRTSFVDGYPLLVTCIASLADLNDRLAEPVPMNRFRPNVVIEGGHSWQEDDWSELTSESWRLRAVKPCARCAVTTTDQTSGRRHAAQEPLRTLARFRTIPRLGAIFGQNMVIEHGGSIVVGDAVAAP